MNAALLRVELGEPIAQERMVRQPRELLLEDRPRVVEEAARSEEIGLLEGGLELRGSRAGRSPASGCGCRGA